MWGNLVRLALAVLNTLKVLKAPKPGPKVDPIPARPAIRSTVETLRPKKPN